MTATGRQVSASLLSAAILFASMAIFSLSITRLGGWNMLLSAVAFWYILVPIIANLSSQILKTNNHFKTAIMGIFVFYAFVFFLTYKQLDTDLGVVMKYSLGSSLFFLFVYHYDRLFPSRSIAKRLSLIAICVGVCVGVLALLIVGFNISLN